jgi:hypothetical protein
MMLSRYESTEKENVFKVELIHANLETAIAFAKLALQSEDQREITRTTQKACEAYEEALHSLSTAALTHIEVESIRTKTERLDSILVELERSR